jgi:hypothetical protein
MICGTLRNFGLKVGMVGTVRFEARIQELVETIPDLAVLVEPLLVVRRALCEHIVILHRRLWVPANHLQAEDRAYRMGQTERVTVEYMLADGTFDVFIADLLEAKLRLIIQAVEADLAPNASVLDELYEKLRALGPALLQENKALQATGEIRGRLEALAKTNHSQASNAPILETGVH